MVTSTTVDKCRLLLLNKNTALDAKNIAIELAYETPDDQNVLQLLFEVFLKFGEDVSAHRILNVLGISGVPMIQESQNLEILKKGRHEIENLHKIRKFSECLQIVQNILRISPYSIEFRLLQAKYLLKLRNFQEAEPVIEEILSEHIHNPIAIFLKGRLKFCIGFVEESYEFFTKALEIDHQCPQIQEMKNTARLLIEPFNLAKIFFRQKKLTDALAILNEEIFLHIQAPEWLVRLRVLRSKVHQEMKNFDKAIEDLSEKTMETKFHRELVLESRAECFFKMENFEKCVSECDDFLKLFDSENIKKLRESAEEKIDEAKILGKFQDSAIQNLIRFQNSPEDVDLFSSVVRNFLYVNNTDCVRNLVKDYKHNPKLLDVARKQINEFRNNPMNSQNPNNQVLPGNGNLLSYIDSLTCK